MATHKEERYQLSIDDFQREGYLERDGIYVHPNITEMEKPIYRYMKLEHLITMLNTKGLYIPHGSSLSDLSERGIKWDPHNIGAITVVPKNKKQRETNNKFLEYVNRIHLASQKIGVSSWTYDLDIKESKGQTIGENFLMWKTYGSKDISCRVETTIAKLITSICRQEDKCVLLSNVKYYVESKPNGDPQQEIFWKPLYYKGEREVRLCVLNQEEHCTLKIDPRNMITEIVLSPFINNDCSRFLTEQLKKYFPDINIRKSRIMEY